MKILFKLTTKGRHEKALRTIKSIIENVSNDNYYIHLTLDDNKTKELLDSNEIIINYLKESLDQKNWGATISFVTNITKIKAINRDMDMIDCDWKILVNVSDDQVFIKKGFDDIIRAGFIDTKFNLAHATTGTPLKEDRISLDQFLHFPDGNRSDLATMSIIGRDYYERDKYIYNPIYANEYCDNEAQEVAKIRGCYKFVDEHIFNHLHGNYGKGEYDQLHKINEQKGFINYDAMKYKQRELNNFGL